MPEELYVVIMAGGGGLRLWPASTKQHPKQFLDLLGGGRTLLQSTFDRAVRLTPATQVLVVTAAEYVSAVHDQLPDLPEANILGEPRKCNTAPCLALAALWIEQRFGARLDSATMLVLSSDHHIPDLDAFTQSVQRALQHTTIHPEALITFGLQPTRPETGYGYIEVTGGGENVEKVRCFREKPNLATAQAYCADGQHLWNSGIFVWRVAALLHAVERFLPQVYEALLPLRKSALWTETLPDAYATCQEVSIDTGVLERSTEVYVVRASFPWSDLGAWSSIAHYMSEDETQNARQGDLLLRDAHHNILHIEKGKFLAAIGLEGYVVACHGNAILICPVEREQEIRELVKEVEKSYPEYV